MILLSCEVNFLGLLDAKREFEEGLFNKLYWVSMIIMSFKMGLEFRTGQYIWPSSSEIDVGKSHMTMVFQQTERPHDNTFSVKVT